MDVPKEFQKVEGQVFSKTVSVQPYLVWGTIFTRGSENFLQLVNYFKGFLKISCFYHLSFLRYLESVNPTSQFRSNFRTELGKTKLLITPNREINMRSSAVLYDLKRKLNVTIFVHGDIKNGALKLRILFLTYLVRHSASAFGFQEKIRSATWKSL